MAALCFLYNMEPGIANDIYFLELSPNPVRFEPVSKLTNVFYDDANRQVFSVRSGGATGVVVKGPDDKTTTNFRMEDKGEVISIKFSPDMKILAIQRCQKSVEFANFSNGVLDTIEYSQCCKGKTTKLLGFAWTCSNEVVFVTDHGVELYQVITEKRSLKALRSHSVSVNWFVYHPENSLLLVSSGTMGNIMFPFRFRSGILCRLSKFEIDLPTIPKPPRLCLLERDVTLASIYSKICVIVLRHQPCGIGAAGAEIVIYTLQKDGPPRKTHVLKLNMSGRFAINIIDDLVIVHHQSTKKSLLFDTKLPGETDGFVTYLHPIVSPHPIKQFMLKVPMVPSHSTSETAEICCELYSPNWVVFQPNVVIDAKLGCLWYVQLKLDPLLNMISDRCLLIDFLLLRLNSKPHILRVLKEALLPGCQLPLDVLSKIFKKLNHVYKLHVDSEKQGQGISSNHSGKQMPVIDQSDIYPVFTMFESNTEISYKFVVAVLLEYICSLTQYKLPIQHYLCELLISTLVQHECFYQLHQFLQYHILSDSRLLACLMLSLQNKYPPAHQLALDMLKRLATADVEIIEVLLSQQQVLPALRFVRSTGNIDSVSAHKFLTAAQETNDPNIFYAVYKFFVQRNVRLRGFPHFQPGENCESFVKHFESLFGIPGSLHYASNS